MMEWIKLVIVAIVFGTILYTVYEALNYNTTHK